MVKWWLLLATAILLLLSGCGSEPSSSSDTPSPTMPSTKETDAQTRREPPSFPSVSDPYTPDQAVANGDIVNVHGNLHHGDRWSLFLSNIDVGIPDQVRITEYTIEGDPIFYELVYDGAEVITYTYDNSMDAFGNDQKRPSTMCRAVKLEPEEGELPAHYALSGCDNGTGDTFWFEADTAQQN